MLHPEHWAEGWFDAFLGVTTTVGVVMFCVALGLTLQALGLIH